MEAVAAKLMGLPERTSADNVVALWDGLRSISIGKAWRVKRTDSSNEDTAHSERRTRKPGRINRSG